MNKPAFIIDIPAEDYHKATKDNEFLTSHRLAIFRRCPLEYKKVIDGVIVQGDTANFVLGRATHTFVLEGEEKFRTEYEVADGPINEKTGKPFGTETNAFKEWAETLTKPAIRTADAEIIAKMREAVMGHETAAKLLSAGFAEGTVRTTWGGIPVQTRMDWFNPETGDLVDLKTCNDIDRFGFDIRDFGYIFQVAFYAKVLELAGYDKEVTPWFIAVEKKEPFRVAVFKVTPSTLDDINNSHMANATNRDDNEAMIAELRCCQEDNSWPTRYEGFGVL